MARVMIIGFGSTIRGDDAFGYLAAEQLIDTIDENKATILARPLLTPDLAEDLNNVELAVFIDISEEGPIGELVMREIEPDQNSTISMVHFLSPQALLYWTQHLYSSAPRAIMFTIRGEDFDFKENTLTPAVGKALDDVVERVTLLIENHCADTDMYTDNTNKQTGNANR